MISAASAPRPGALHGAGDGQHLPHARPALGALVADDHDVAGVDAPGQHGLEGGLLAVEHPGAALEAVDSRCPATLTTEPLGASEPRSMARPPTCVERCVPAVDDLAVGGRRLDQLEVLAARSCR